MIDDAHEGEMMNKRGWTLLPGLMMGLMAQLLTSNVLLAQNTKSIKPDTTKINRYYADPSAPNISGVWRVVRDNYRPLLVSNTQARDGVATARKPNSSDDNGGLPPGVLPRNFWIVDGKPLPGRGPGGPWVGIPFTPKWQAAYDQRVADNLVGKVHGDPYLDCQPRGAMAIYNHAGDLAFAITQTPGRVQQLIEEQSQVRSFYTDGRKHALWADINNDDYEPTPFGDSIGHWEGKTLVVDTIGIRKEYTMGYYAPHSDVFHVIERFTRIDDTHLDVDIVVDDQKALLKPMSMKLRYQLQPADQDFKQDVCDNYRNFTDNDGYMQTVLKPKKHADWDLPQE